MSDSSFDSELPQELTERGKRLLETVKPGSRMERRTPQVMIEELKYALWAYQNLGLSADESRELLLRHRTNWRKRIAVWGISNIGAPVPDLDMRPFPKGYEVALERLERACNALISLCKRRGRPRNTLAILKAKQPLSSRYLNFGKGRIKWTVENYILLISAVEAVKLKYDLTNDADALRNVAKRMKPEARLGIIETTAKRLATPLSRARKRMSGNKDYEKAIQDIVMAWNKNNDT